MGVPAARGTRLSRRGLKEPFTWPRLRLTRGQFRAAAAAVFGHPGREQRAFISGGAIGATAVPSDRWDACAGCAQFRRTRSADDRPSPRYRSHRGRGRSVRGNGTRDRDAGIPACRGRCPVLPSGASAPARLAPSMGTPGPLCAVPARVDDPDAGEWISCRTRRNRLAAVSWLSRA